MPHVHDWQPMPLECGRYRCDACESEAYRRYDGTLRISKTRYHVAAAAGTPIRNRTSWGGRVPPLPPLFMLEDERCA